MSPDTIRFLIGLLNSVNLSVGSPSFDTDVAHIQQARSELNSLLPEPDAVPDRTE